MCSVTFFSPRMAPVGPLAWTGQPRCAQRFEMMVKLGTLLPTAPLLRTNAVRRDTSPCLGSVVNVAMNHFPTG